MSFRPRFALLALVGCAPELDSATPPALDGLDFPVDAPGPFGVGYRTWPVTYTPGEGIAPRTIVVNLWYPTSADSTGSSTPDTMGFPLEDTLLDAPLAESAYGGTYPVNVHSHGWMGWAANSDFLAHYFASHGWLFVAPDHTDNLLDAALDPLPLAHWAERPMDVSQTLDALDSDTTLAGHAATTEVLLSGHSFGTYTTWASSGATFGVDAITARCDAGQQSGGTCSPAELALFTQDLSDDRIVATLPLAGSYGTDWFGDTGYQTSHGPVFAMSGTEDDVGDQGQWDLMPDIDIHWVELTGGCHQSFGIGTCATLDTAAGFQIVDTYALAWAREQVLGDESVSGIVEGSVAVSDLAVVHQR